MYELIQISENDYYIDFPSKVGIVNIGNGESVVIDTGIDRDMGNKINKILESHAYAIKNNAGLG